MRYAMNYQDGWTVYEAPVGVMLGGGTIIVSGLTEEEMEDILADEGIFDDANKKCAGFGFFYEDDHIVRMPPIRKYTVRAKIKSVEKGTPRFVGLEENGWDELSDEGLLADLRLKAHVGEETLNGFEELVDQSASPHILAEEYWTYDDWQDWLMGDEDESEDATLVSSGTLERLKARAMEQNPSTDWESELDAM